MTTAQQLRLHRRAVQVLDAMGTIEHALAQDDEAKFRAADPAEQVRILDDLETIEELTFETEARLTLCPLKPGGAR